MEIDWERVERHVRDKDAPCVPCAPALSIDWVCYVCETREMNKCATTMRRCLNRDWCMAYLREREKRRADG